MNGVCRGIVEDVVRRTMERVGRFKSVVAEL